MEQTVRELIAQEIVADGDPAAITAQGAVLTDPGVLVENLTRLRDRVDAWIQYFDAPDQGADPWRSVRSSRSGGAP